MQAKVKKPAAPTKPNGKLADLKATGDAIADAKVAELKAQLEALGYQVKEKRSTQNINDEMVAALTDVVAKFGGVDDPSTKASFIKARKTLWPIDEATKAYNKAAAARRKAKEAQS
jgi:hypothetical protein